MQASIVIFGFQISRLFRHFSTALLADAGLLNLCVDILEFRSACSAWHGQQTLKRKRKHYWLIIFWTFEIVLSIGIPLPLPHQSNFDLFITHHEWLWGRCQGVSANLSAMSGVSSDFNHVVRSLWRFRSGGASGPGSDSEAEDSPVEKAPAKRRAGSDDEEEEDEEVDSEEEEEVKRNNCRRLGWLRYRPIWAYQSNIWHHSVSQTQVSDAITLYFLPNNNPKAESQDLVSNRRKRYTKMTLVQMNTVSK